MDMTPSHGKIPVLKRIALLLLNGVHENLWDEIVPRLYAEQTSKIEATAEEVAAGLEEAYQELSRIKDGKMRRYLQTKEGGEKLQVESVLTTPSELVISGYQRGDEVDLLTPFGHVGMKITELLSFKQFQAKLCEFTGEIWPSSYKNSHEQHVCYWLKKLERKTMQEKIRQGLEDLRESVNEFLLENSDERDSPARAIASAKECSSVAYIGGKYIFKEKKLRQWLANEHWSLEWTKDKLIQALPIIFKGRFEDKLRIDNVRFYAIKTSKQEILNDSGWGKNHESSGDSLLATGSGDGDAEHTSNVLLEGDYSGIQSTTTES